MGHLCRCLRDLNKLMMPRLLPKVTPRLDYDAAPYYNRTADEVGNYYFLHRCAQVEHQLCTVRPSIAVLGWRIGTKTG